MKGQDHTFTVLTVDPWIYMLAVIIGIVLFFCCAACVQASLPSAPAAFVESKPMAAEVKMADTQFNLRAKFDDYTDITNERAGDRQEKAHPVKLKGTVQSEAKRSFVSKIIDAFGFIFGFPPAEQPLPSENYVNP